MQIHEQFVRGIGEYGRLHLMDLALGLDHLDLLKR